MPLKTFNYFFGANGSGKTTISKIIACPEDYKECGIVWENGIQLETRVYNRDFVERNFNPQGKLKGIFTLGVKDAEKLREIENSQLVIEQLRIDIGELRSSLEGKDGIGGKQKELAVLNSKYKTTFWKQKQKHGDRLSGGLTGYLADSEKFMQKVLSEVDQNQSILLSQDELEEKAATIFSKSISPAEIISTNYPDNLLALESNQILKKHIVGKNDVNIAEMINKLGNSDWVNQGRPYYEANNGFCPFCQQKIAQEFEQSLSEYFDETYEQDKKLVYDLLRNYLAESQRFQNEIQDVIEKQYIFLDSEKIKSEKLLLDSLISGNLRHLGEKQKEMSNTVILDTLENVVTSILMLIEEANRKAKDHNDIVKNIREERTTLINQIWRFIVSELAADIKEYIKKKNNLDKEISHLTRQIKEKDERKYSKETELNNLQKNSKTIKPTRDGINSLLSSFGFTSFKLEICDDQKTYKLVREDGSEAQKTLSEGEKNFLTFLYFYYLLQGSQEETENTNEMIVVFDDPISSLDNDVMFIVSSLIRDVIKKIEQNDGYIRQIIILTHNIYFHKEVTYNCADRKKKNKTTFWLVKKNDCNSIVQHYNENPIKTSYDLLWEEIRNDCRNKSVIQNVLRRILENYFKLLGNKSLKNLSEKFSGDEKIICNALCSWINAGSHGVFDEEFFTPLDEAMIEKYLKVFKQIFFETGQEGHYNMMMGISSDSEAEMDLDETNQS